VTANHPFSLSFTAASLRPELVRVIAETFTRTGDWGATKERILATNALQARSPSSGIRMERELRQRLMHLTPGELDLAAHGNADERSAIAWLAALKSSSYIHSFAAEVLRGKLASFDPVLRASDYEAFVENQAAMHPEVRALTPSSQAKIRSVLMSMLCEAGIGQRLGRELRIGRPVLPASVYTTILQDSSSWLAGFLVPDAEIGVNSSPSCPKTRSKPSI